jgi:hypothetical protein
VRFKVRGLRSRIQSSGLRVYSLRFGAVIHKLQVRGVTLPGALSKRGQCEPECSTTGTKVEIGYRVEGSGFRVQGSGFRV